MCFHICVLCFHHELLISSGTILSGRLLMGLTRENTFLLWLYLLFPAVNPKDIRREAKGVSGH